MTSPLLRQFAQRHNTRLTDTGKEVVIKGENGHICEIQSTLFYMCLTGSQTDRRIQTGRVDYPAGSCRSDVGAVTPETALDLCGVERKPKHCQRMKGSFPGQTVNSTNEVSAA